MVRSLTAQEAADRPGYNIKHLYRLLNSGKVNGQRVGHIWLIDPQEVERIKDRVEDCPGRNLNNPSFR